MSFEYIANAYGKTFKQGQVVRVTDTSQKPPPPGKLGVVTKADNYVWVRLSDEKNARPYHPSDVEAADG